jgi:hypothetical protein
MKITEWKSIAELIGIAAIVASLVFVGIQLRQEQDIALAEIFEASESSAAAIDFEINENTAVWLKSKNGEDLTESEESIIGRIVGSMYRRARIQTTMRRNVASGGNATLIEFAIELRANPGARRIWEAQVNEEVALFEKARPGDDYRRSYRDEVLQILDTME